MGGFEEFVEQSQNARTEAELRVAFARTMAAEGFENYLLCSLGPKDVSRTMWVEVANGYFDFYVAERRELIDPILTQCVRATRPFLWERVVAGTTLRPEQTKFLQEVKSFGVHSVVWLPFLGRDGRRDGIGLSRRHADPPNIARLPVWHAIAAQTWSRFLELAGDDAPLAPCSVSLTAKEMDVLSWMKDGKSNPDIAEILSLSVKTVEYHVTHILRKLGASNRIGAVVIAIKRGIVAI